jgi:DNA-binding transcriptional ArsR family regulator
MSTSSLDFAKALADKTRQQIMALCCCEWRSVGELAERLGVAQPTISHHLAILRAANLVQARPEGRQTYYQLDQSRVVMCCGELLCSFAPEAEATQVVNRALPDT